MVVTFGERINGNLAPLSLAQLSSGQSEVGQIYEVTLETDGIPDPQMAANKLLEELPKHEPTAKIFWMRVDNETIVMQIHGSPFLWTALFGAAATVLALIGINVISGSASSIIPPLPEWWWIPLLLLGGGLVVIWLLSRKREQPSVVVVK